MSWYPAFEFQGKHCLHSAGRAPSRVEERRGVPAAETNDMVSDRVSRCRAVRLSSWFWPLADSAPPLARPALGETTASVSMQPAMAAAQAFPDLMRPQNMRWDAGGLFGRNTISTYFHRIKVRAATLP